jgi:hypothetical protein
MHDPTRDIAAPQTACPHYSPCRQICARQWTSPLRLVPPRRSAAASHPLQPAGQLLLQGDSQRRGRQCFSFGTRLSATTATLASKSVHRNKESVEVKDKVGYIDPRSDSAGTRRHHRGSLQRCYLRCMRGYLGADAPRRCLFRASEWTLQHICSTRCIFPLQQAQQTFRLRAIHAAHDLPW